MTGSGRIGTTGRRGTGIVALALLWACTGGAAAPVPDDFGARLARAALERTTHDVRYDPSYVAIPYPGGDVPDGRGVCTDVIVRAYRALGIDLQRDVHEEMTAAFDAFPSVWGLTRPDPNIDHRRVPNLETLFARRGTVLPLTRDAADYAPGDLVTWRLGGHIPHIGIVTGRFSPAGRPLVVHNIGWGTRADDVLFAYPLHGHYRYRGHDAAPKSASQPSPPPPASASSAPG
jgi:uncharacterized protein YijF (DUF1287 family)